MTGQFSVEGVLIPSELVAYRAMNFRQPIPERTPFPYTLRRPVAEIAARLGHQAQQCIGELREEFDKFGDDDDAVTVALAEAGWPSAAEVFRSRPDLMSLILREYLYFDILNLYAPARGGAYDFLVNTLDEVVRDGDEVVVTGQGYERGEGSGSWRRPSG
jgi:hypothetical protein